MSIHRPIVDTISIVGTIATAALAMSDIAVGVTIAVGLSTLLYNIVRLIREVSEWRRDRK